MNWKTIGNNIKEAREQLQEIEERISTGDFPDVGEFQVMLEHTYHHLNFAWNIRNVSTKRYTAMTEEEFNKWGNFPKQINQFILSDNPTEADKGTNKSKAAFRQAHAVEAVASLQRKSVEDGTDGITMDEINAEIKAFRGKRRTNHAS